MVVFGVYTSCFAFICRSQATLIAKTTGYKGSYPLQKLKLHNPVQQIVPDAMHTVKDAIEHFFYLIIGKEGSTKVMKAEVELKRLGRNCDIPPYQISKGQKKIADMRACSIICPDYVDFTPTAFFTKTQFKSHDWKQVI